MGAFTEVTKLDEAIGLNTVLNMMSSRFSQWEDLRPISVSIILMSHDLSQTIRIGSETNRRVIY